MRNKLLLAMAVTGMMYGVSAYAIDEHTPPAKFGSGTVTFRGTILNAPCDIATGDDKLDVDFGQVSYRSLKAHDVADDAHAKNFTITLKNCEFDKGAIKSGGNQTAPDLMSMVQIAFSGTPAAGSKKAFVSATDPNLGVQLTDAKGTIIEPLAVPDFAKAGDPVQLNPGDNMLVYTAKLMNVGTTDGSVKTGAFSIPVNYTLKYQ
ncbi:fimbrial protein [Salmonella enterica]|nr:fimbrial protein [Salmonella enterica]ECZ8681667.1 fimbrial protein [Salmonella enterica]EHR2733513.1 fimbrial protein [Salmonella enterica]EIR9720267.1 fimbrial protein [Salmonella enterica]EJB7842707.1 fimbrial protein [Salmonella enterica]